MTRALLPALLLAALPALAETPMTAEAFQTYTEGKTLYYGRGGDYYGVERYKPGHRVTWSFLDGRCLEGEWYQAQNGQICFVYEDDATPHCWTFFQGAQGLVARFGDDPEAIPLYEATERDDPMQCMGPDVGA